MNNPTVSIIIPTYNRAHLIGETLESILAQTYENWECIIVDDGSTDNTDEVVQPFLKKDERFQYHKRPVDRKKGANACRNYGFEICKGEYVNWFDSDDLMMSRKLEIQVFNIVNTSFDFCISKSILFKDDINVFYEDKMYNRNSNKVINVSNFLTGNFFWITNDFLGRKESLKYNLFNEFLKSGQEYHFFIGYLLNKNNGVYIEESLTLRRKHINSIQSIQNKDNVLKNKNRAKLYAEIYNDFKENLNKDQIIYVLKRKLNYNNNYLIVTNSKSFFLKEIKILKKHFNLFTLLSLYLLLYLAYIKKDTNLLHKGFFKRLYYKL